MILQNNPASCLAHNLTNLRKRNGFTQEKVAEAVGVSRQALAKWETGDSVPGIQHCDALAALYDVTLDDLVRFDEETEGYGPPPKNKYVFGVVQVGERGQIVIPKKARDVFGIKHGDTLVVLGDANPASAGIALVQNAEGLFPFLQQGKEEEE